MANKIVLITGGTGALGKTVCQAFLAQGYQVAVTYRDDKEIRDLLDSVGDDKDRLDAWRVDVTDPSSLDELAYQIEKKHGMLSSLVCLVGGFTPGTFGDDIYEQFDKMMTLNAKSFLLTCDAVLPLLQASVKQGKGKSYGTIVAVAAKPAVTPVKNLGIYAASKAAVVSLVKTMAVELLEENILVNAIAPSTIDTAANRKSMPKADPKKWVTPDQIAQTIFYLATQEVTSGAIVPVYGKS